MNKKHIYIGIGIIVVLLLILIIPKYFTGNFISDTQINSGIEKIEIIHFHATRQCYTCKTLGAYSEETVNTYFEKELESGKLVFGHINVDEPENKVLVEKYIATGSSLLIGVYGKDGSFSKQEDTNVWYKINNKEGYLSYLKEVIDTKFSGA